MASGSKRAQKTAYPTHPSQIYSTLYQSWSSKRRSPSFGATSSLLLTLPVPCSILKNQETAWLLQHRIALLYSRLPRLKMQLTPKPECVETQEPSGVKPLTGQQDTQGNLNTANIHEDATITESSPLKRLPLELRQKIYGYVVGAPEQNCLIILPSNELLAVRETCVQTRHVIVDTWSKFSYKRQFWTFFTLNRLALLRTCRQVYTDAVDIFYQVNTFIIKHQIVLERFVCTVRHEQFDQIRNLNVSVTVYARAWISSCQGPYFGRLGWDAFWQSSCNGEIHRQEWEAFWSTITGMKNLQSLTSTWSFGDLPT